ncbi:hypothetical protein EYF80_008874 [Liparis tanakae]|uniref:Uncharacterized protein n=1 Tax=Liparis tanakae TaxID=230148 RepID=A0A4Z2IS91_9TELE|nr:hypothetical protein EYF80_008874 [Liparis tanakae]
MEGGQRSLASLRDALLFEGVPPHPPRPMHSDINYPPLYSSPYSNKANSRGAAALSETLAEHLPA